VVEHRSGKSRSNADALSHRPDCNRPHDRRKCPLRDAEFMMGDQCITDPGQKISVETDGVGRIVTTKNGRAQGMNGTAYGEPSVLAGITVSEGANERHQMSAPATAPINENASGQHRESAQATTHICEVNMVTYGMDENDDAFVCQIIVAGNDNEIRDLQIADGYARRY
jgi:hypothetical protein